MTRRAWFGLLVLTLAAAVAPAVRAQDDAPRISLRELKALMVSDRVLVVDVRDHGSFAAGHIPGAINVPSDQLKGNLATLRATKKSIVTYCA